MIRGRVVARMSNQEVCREKRTNRDLGPPVRALRIGRCGGGCASATVEENSTIAPSDSMRVKSHVRRAVDNGAHRFADRAVKAASRAQRGRSEAERLERAIRELQNGSATALALS